MHVNLSPGAYGHMHVWITCVRVCVCTGVLSPGMYGPRNIGLYVCVVARAGCVCVQTFPCEHVSSRCVWPVMPSSLVSLDNKDLGAPDVSLSIPWGRQESRSRERPVSEQPGSSSFVHLFLGLPLLEGQGSWGQDRPPGHGHRWGGWLGGPGVSSYIRADRLRKPRN